ncbi:hypothetical protein N665_0252s0004 [Sinapis alba]|nr:hypothetical protein N665_0252s0004 [Sinapis alba]
MEPPEDAKSNFSKEIYGEDLHLSKPGENHGSFFGSSDDEPSEAYSMNKETEKIHEKFHTVGYCDGISAGQNAAAQEGYNVGYRETTKLPDSVHDLSTEVAMKVFYGTLTTKQVEDKSGEEGPESSLASVSIGVTSTTDLGSYVTDLSSLLNKSPTIEVRLLCGEEGLYFGPGSGAATTDLGSYVM